MSRLDYGTIHRHLQDLERSLAALEQMREKNPCRLQERHHQVLGLGAPLPDEYRGIILALGEQGVIPAGVADALAPMAGLFHWGVPESQ
ncbi:MAG: hypothetical protein ACOX20_04415 [Limnochordia bacterium]